MYDAPDVLNSIDADTGIILAGFAIAMTLQNIAMVSAIVMTRREGWISIPLPCTFLWFAHDLGAVVRFDVWFNDYDHWFMKLFWLGLLSALLLELVFFAQAIRVGRREHLPRGTQAQWTALVVGGAICFVALWEYEKTVWDDPLYQAPPPMTLFLLPIATTALIMRRGSAVAQSPVIYGCFAAMTVFWWAITMAFYGDGFRSWQYGVVGALTFAMLVAVTVLVVRMRSREATEPAAPKAVAALVP